MRLLVDQPPALLRQARAVGALQLYHATRARLSEARTTDGLKAAEMLAKLCGWNTAEQVKHDHVHVQVDSALIQQLRAGYAQLSERSAKACLPLPAGGCDSQEMEAGHTQP